MIYDKHLHPVSMATDKLGQACNKAWNVIALVLLLFSFFVSFFVVVAS